MFRPELIGRGTSREELVVPGLVHVRTVRSVGHGRSERGVPGGGRRGGEKELRGVDRERERERERKRERERRNRK